MIFAPSMLTVIESALGEASTPLLTGATKGIAESAVDIWGHLAKVGMASSASTSNQNHFGEMTKDIDIFAKQSIISHTQISFSGVIVATEEDEAQQYSQKAQYAILTDPLDGSGHVGYHSTCGTFFSVLALSQMEKPIMSGYALYGYQLILVLAINDKLLIAIYNPDSRQFSVLFNNYKMPSHGNTYSVCDSDINDFPDLTRDFVENLRNSNYKARYNGVLVADLHRIIMEGGIFLSPQLESGKTKAKRCFEAIPIGHLLRAASGLCVYSYHASSNTLMAGHENELFGTVPLIFGSKLEIEKYNKITGTL